MVQQQCRQLRRCRPSGAGAVGRHRANAGFAGTSTVSSGVVLSGSTRLAVVSAWTNDDSAGLPLAAVATGAAAIAAKLPGPSAGTAAQPGPKGAPAAAGCRRAAPARAAGRVLRGRRRRSNRRLQPLSREDAAATAGGAPRGRGARPGGSCPSSSRSPGPAAAAVGGRSGDDHRDAVPAGGAGRGTGRPAPRVCTSPSAVGRPHGEGCCPGAKSCRRPTGARDRRPRRARARRRSTRRRRPAPRPGRCRGVWAQATPAIGGGPRGGARSGAGVSIRDAILIGPGRGPAPLDPVRVEGVEVVGSMPISHLQAET